MVTGDGPGPDEQALPPPSPYHDARSRIGMVVMMAVGLFFAAAYGTIAVVADLPGLWAGVPVALLGVVCVYLAQRRWAQRGQRGGLWMLVGSLLVIGSVWAAFMTSNALL
ncbi:hypothetical protein [Phycicoccus sonneratiae]|uniref:DUF4190 domain-containing protein n=1 Tax=Phycicoccus sonneratiae TaxID=2807628 RepID=A0ABS2CH24_9MICO|nr:hypothetical protein [Phycicoccus sonneraticus]MBM6399171.1 hypothetical protein [Phycicoccus sonneraticus]